MGVNVQLLSLNLKKWSSNKNLRTNSLIDVVRVVTVSIAENEYEFDLNYQCKTVSKKR